MKANFSKGQTVYVPYDKKVVKCKIMDVKQKPSFWNGELLVQYEISGIFPLGNQKINTEKYEILRHLVSSEQDICFHNGRFASKIRGEWEENVFASRYEAKIELLKRERKKEQIMHSYNRKGITTYA